MSKMPPISETVEHMNLAIKFLEARAADLPEGREKKITLRQLESIRAEREKMIASPQYYTGEPYSWTETAGVADWITR